MKKVSEEGKIGRKLSDHKLNRRSDAEWLHLKPLNEGKKRSLVKAMPLCYACHNVLVLLQTLKVPPSPVTMVTMTRSSQRFKHLTHPPTRHLWRLQIPSKTTSRPPRRMEARQSITAMGTLTVGTATQTRR